MTLLFWHGIYIIDISEKGFSSDTKKLGKYVGNLLCMYTIMYIMTVRIRVLYGIVWWIRKRGHLGQKLKIEIHILCILINN